MSLSAVAAVVSLAVRLMSEAWLLWCALVASCGIVVVVACVTCHDLICSGNARFLSVESERGVTAIEYGLIASLIALAVIVSVKLVGTNLGGLFTYVGGKIVTP
jgi:pilus assembly protein Flp/PilA